MPNEHGSDNPAPDSETQTLSQVPAAPTARQEGALPNSSHGQTNNQVQAAKEFAREFRAAEKWVIGTNIALGIIGIFALCIYHGQLNALLESNRINNESLVSVQRAFLTCQTITQMRHVLHGAAKPHGVRDFTLPCENTGTTPANLIAQAFFTAVSDTEPTEEQFARKPLIQNAVIGPKASRQVGFVRTNDADIFGRDLPDTAQEIVSMPIQTGFFTRTHIFWGWVAYRDVFPDTDLHITESCQRLFGVTIDRGNLQNPFAFGYIPCDHHNCADKNCDDYQVVVELASKK